MQVIVDLGSTLWLGFVSFCPTYSAKENVVKILTESEIKRAIRGCNPTKVAVAYIGSEWNTFIRDTDRLSTIIVSPTFGSNPRAITDLARQIGWSKLLFLDELHAKTYIGTKSAVIGSANLTRNGLSGEKLVELCVEINSNESIRKLNQIFDDLKRRAKEEYPTTRAKKVRLKQMEKSWGAAVANGIIRSEKRKTQSFADFELLGEDHFYVLWYQPFECEYSDDVKAIESLVADDIHFANTDKVEKNKWALIWRITDSNKPHKIEKPIWLYIHEIFKNGVIEKDYDYPKCAIQREDLNIPSPPFKITKNVSEAFKKAIREKEIAKYLIQDGRDVFSLAYSLKGVPLLIGKMKEYLANKANADGIGQRHD